MSLLPDDDTEPTRRVTSDEVPTGVESPYVVEFPESTEATTVIIILTPIDPEDPVAAEVEVKACLKPVGVSTTVRSTSVIAGETTTMLVQSTTAAAVPSGLSSKTPSTTTTPGEYCEEKEGMSDSSLIPDERLQTTPGSDVSTLRPGDEPWTSDVDSDQTPTITVVLTADDSLTDVNQVRLPVLNNVRRVEVILLPEMADQPSRTVTSDDVPSGMAPGYTADFPKRN